MNPSPSGLKSRRPLFQDERADPVRILRLVRHRHRHANVRVVAVGRKRLRPIEHPVLAVSPRSCPRTARIRTSFRFRKRPRPNLFALRKRQQIFLLLPVVPELEDVIAAQRIVRRHDQPNRSVDPRELLNRNRVLDITKARAAKLLRENHSQQPHRGQLRHNLQRKMRSLVPLHHMRRNLALGEFAHAAPQLLLLFGEGEIHGILGGSKFYLYPAKL